MPIPILKEMKTSVRIAAGVSEGEAEGKEAAVIESIFSNKSVDFVTYAGAGGQVEAMESAAIGDVDVMSMQELSERRPDLVEYPHSRPAGDRRGNSRRRIRSRPRPSLLPRST